MCYLCDGGTPDELRRDLERHIEEIGWAIGGVEGPARTGWAYTIGLSERFDHPELVLTGTCCSACAGQVLNGLGRRVAAGDVLAPGDEIAPHDGAERRRIGAVHPEHWTTDRFNMWLELYSSQPWASPTAHALQVLWLDHRGRWQDDPRNRRWPFERLDRAPHRTSLVHTPDRTGGPPHHHARRRRRRHRP